MPRAISKHSGFTLLELIVVMVIIRLLAGYVGPLYFAQIDKSAGSKCTGVELFWLSTYGWWATQLPTRF